MRVLRVTYRASFIQPIGAMNPMGLKLKMPIEVEIFESKEGMWKARRPNTSYEFDEIKPTYGQESMKQTVLSCFETQQTDWVMHGEKGRVLEPHEWVAKENRIYLLEPDDFTHMPKLETPHPDKRKGYGVCLGAFRHDQFISLNQDIAPTCRECLTAWEARKKVTA